METNQTHNTLDSLIKNPSQLADILKDPGKNGLEFYNGLSKQHKKYVLMAAGIGLVIYGIYVSRQLDDDDEVVETA
jgi:hypothetical protein